MSLAFSILTFVYSLLEFLPERQDALVKHESLYYNTLLCLITPLVIAYCSRSKVLAALSHRWVYLRRCLVPDCQDPTGSPIRVLHALNLLGQTASIECRKCAMHVFDATAQAVSGQSGCGFQHGCPHANAPFSALISSGKIVT